MLELNKIILDGKQMQNLAFWTEKRNSQFWMEFGQKMSIVNFTFVGTDWRSRYVKKAVEYRT